MSIKLIVAGTALTLSACQLPADRPAKTEDVKVEPAVEGAVNQKSFATAELDRTAWQIVSVNGVSTEAVLEDSRARRNARIEFASGNANGSSGCNFFGGLYAQIGRKLYFGRSISTAMGCGGAIGRQEKALNSLLSGEANARLDRNGQLHLANGAQQAVLERDKNCISCGSAGQPEVRLVGPVWNIEAINGQQPFGRDVVKNEGDYFLRFSKDELQYRVGCNTFGSGYRIDANRLIALSGTGTEIGCTPELLEQDNLVGRILSENPVIVHGHNMDMLLASKAGMIELQGPPDQRK